MRVFNAFQLVSAFVACPYVITWLADAPFHGAGVAFYSACALYVVGFLFMVAATADLLNDL